MKDLRVTLVQSEIIWQNPAANLAHYTSLLADLSGTTDLIILPEMFTTGFTMDAATQAEPMNGPSMQWMVQQAKQLQAVVCGSLIITEGENFFNRLIWMPPNGDFQTYDKRHLFAMAGEDDHYRQGVDRLIVHYKGWRTCPMICYDLRFPVWARNDNAYDLLIYIASWPNKRSYDWLSLLKARAIENQCYTIGVNRVGTDENKFEYNGDSCVIDPGWKQVIYQQEKITAVHTETLSADHLQKVRSSLPFLQDQDSWSLTP